MLIEQMLKISFTFPQLLTYCAFHFDGYDSWCRTCAGAWLITETDFDVTLEIVVLD